MKLATGFGLKLATGSGLKFWSKLGTVYIVIETTIERDKDSV